MKVSDKYAMAFLYARFRDIISSMPTSIDDFFAYTDLPDGYKDYESGDGDDGLWTLIEQADRYAQKVMKGK